MKKLITSSVLFLMCITAYSQNTFPFPASGNVGIGTSSPFNPLHISSDTNNHQLRLEGLNGKHSWIQFYPSGNSVINWQLGANVNGFSIYDINTSQYRFTVANDGKVGIGTPTPNSSLHIKALNNSINGGITLESNNSTHKWSLDANDAGNFRIYKGTTPIARFNDAGNFGIGTTSPIVKLEVKTESGNNLIRSISGETSIAGIDFGDTNQNDIGRLRYDNSNNILTLSTHYHNANININPHGIGNVGIGTTSPEYKLNVESSDFIVSKFNRISGSGGAAIEMENGLKTGSWRFGVGANNAFSIYKSSNNFGEQFTIDDDGNVGIGTTSPEVKLHIKNGNNSYGAILANSSETAFSLYTKSLDRVPNTETFRLGLKHNTNENNGYISFYRGGGDGGGFLGFSTNGSERVRITDDGKVGIGTNDTKGFKLGVNGRVAATEVKVATYNNWPDYVFEKDYDLPTLKEVENHIKEKGHLSSIPSAAEVAENGIFLGEMNAKLLQKIEELTLYTIQQQKELNAEKEKNTSLEKRLLKLEKIITTIIE